MPNKKSDSDDTTPEQAKLERRVDALMSVETLPKKTPSTKPAPPSDTPAAEPATVSATAPPLPPRLLKTIDQAAKPAKSKPARELPADIALSIGDPEEDKAVLPAADLPDEAAPPTTENSAPPDNNLLENSDTDKAVDDIMAKEADTQLAVDDARARRRSAEAESRGHKPNLLVAFFTSPWTWLVIIGTVSVVYLWYR